ncbi:M15 family metallopeptidase [Oxalobacteraceae bacterium A2-2]
MFLFSMLLLFVLVCAGAALLVFPAGRELAWRVTAGWGGWLEGGWRRLGHGGARQGARLATVMVALLRRALSRLRRHLLLAACAAVLVLAPPLLALLLGARIEPGYGQQAPANAQVEDLLKGEQLAAPAALPPPVFLTAEVARERPLLGAANRNWQQLAPEFAQRLLLVFRIMRERHGYEMAILEGYRSPERQSLLAAAGPSVSNARAFQSYHQFGLAADCAFLKDGKLLISERDPWTLRGYRLYGETAEALGLHWGGRWTMLDYGHTELRAPGVLHK